jgi:hypothetical protein
MSPPPCSSPAVRPASAVLSHLDRKQARRRHLPCLALLIASSSSLSYTSPYRALDHGQAPPAAWLRHPRPPSCATTGAPLVSVRSPTFARTLASLPPFASTHVRRCFLCKIPVYTINLFLCRFGAFVARILP